MPKRAPTFLVLFIAILSPLLLCVAVTILIQPRFYQSTARVEFGFRSAPSVYDPFFIGREIAKLGSDTNIEATLTQLSLIEKYAKLERREGSESLADAVQNFHGRLKIEQNRNTGLTSVIVQSEDPGEAAALANKLIQVRIETTKDDPKSAIVEFVDRAVPAARWVSPNIPLLSTVGLLLSALIAGISAWVIRRILSARNGISDKPTANPDGILPSHFQP